LLILFLTYNIDTSQSFTFEEYCEKYAKPEEILSDDDDDDSMSEDGSDSDDDDDDEIVGKADPWLFTNQSFFALSLLHLQL